MWTAKWILDAYVEGEESDRLDLYMAYPNLRSYFDEIEARPEGPGEQNPGRVADKPEKTRWNPCSRLVKGFGA
jgi:hypothetical protein